VRIPAEPTIYEINTAVWLERLGRARGRPLTLEEVPGSEWDALAALPVDAVWLMGVWERSPIGRAVALDPPRLRAGYRAALPDVEEDDVLGSPYCVRDYLVDERFGGPEGLGNARQRLVERNLALILDYVPNHVAPDHPWVTGRPECLLGGERAELAARPKEFMEIEGRVFAKGRDPYFEPWQDVLQLNAFSPDLREAAAETVAAIADQCDGVRCDMAMLMTNEVFARTWGERAGRPPTVEFWPSLIGRCRQAHPDFLFIAEVYWDMEAVLHAQGFDLCYDKRLYDLLVRDPPQALSDHLQADDDYQRRLIRFIENHDEPRAAPTFGSAPGRAAAVVMSTLQGARLYHDGQLDGFQSHVPIQLGRGPAEPPDGDLRMFYERLLRTSANARAGARDWCLCDCTRGADDPHPQLVAWSWSTPRGRYVVVVNLSPAEAEGQVRLPWLDLSGRIWVLTDQLSASQFTQPGEELAGHGLRVALESSGYCFLALETDDRSGIVADVA
jgi:Alpha amylase, catalytic domain